MEELGYVLSEQGKPNTFSYSFVITNPEEVKKGIYVVTENEAGKVIGFLEDIIRGNRYFENVELLSNYQKNLKKHFPIEDWHNLIGEVSVLGIIKKDKGKGYKFERSTLPAIPGNKVEKASEEMLKAFIGIDENGISVGKLFGHDVEVKLNISKLFQKHLAILAMSGAGKSNLTKVLIEELLKRENESIAALVIDIHGEYKSLANFSQKVEVIKAEEIKIPAKEINIFLLSEIFKDLSRPQASELRKVLEGGFTTFEELLEKTKQAEIKENIKNAILRKLEELKSLNIVGEGKSNEIWEKLKEGKTVVLDFSNLESSRKLHIIAFYLLKKLFEKRKKSKKEGKGIPPTIVFIEEAHNLSPKDIESSLGIAKPYIEKIAREGRKFNLSLCLITQRPSHLSQTALSQCNTQIIMRITNPNDHDFIRDASDKIDNRVIRNISSLNVGEGIILGEAVNAPIFVEFKRATSLSKEGETFEEEAREFLKRMKEVEDAYL